MCDVGFEFDRGFTIGLLTEEWGDPNETVRMSDCSPGSTWEIRAHTGGPAAEPQTDTVAKLQEYIGRDGLRGHRAGLRSDLLLRKQRREGRD